MTTAQPVVNRLLTALPSKVLHSVLADCERVALTRGNVLSEPGERIRDVYFPAGSFISLVAELEREASLEVALVGDEGMVGLPRMFGLAAKPLRAVVQGSGDAWRMHASNFRRVLATQPQLRRVLDVYACVRLAQVTQNSLCASFHSIEARLARRLLMTQDLAHCEHFSVTQETLASMLGVRRVSITCTAGLLRRKKLIRYSRGNITVLDRRGLKSAACTCYQGRIGTSARLPA